jgi:competence protein ComEC
MAGSGRPGRSARGAAAAALAGTGFARPRDWRIALERVPQFLRACVAEEVEQRRLFPWIAVAFGLGIVLFFAAEGRPALWAPLAGFVLAGAAAAVLRHRLWASAAAVGVAAAFAGFAAGVVRTARVEAPILTRTTIGALAGFVESIDERVEGGRMVVRVHDLAGVERAQRPAVVRVTLRDASGLTPGDFITAKARLMPPPEAARPGGYDFARDAYYRGIGAVGSILGKAEVAAAPVPRESSLVWAAEVDKARNALTRRIADAIGGQAGAVGAALVTGKRGLIDEDTNDVLRAAGIYHIVSISGLHMVLAAGVFLFIARALLALSQHAALFWPVKKIAAVVAMAGATAYCIFSGADVATERSLIMILVMLGAILFDRTVLSMRNLAISALIVLAREPESLLGPSFQMSYGAVAALIMLAGILSRRRRRAADGERAEGLLARALQWLRKEALGIVLTTFVASLATAPFSAYHFQTANPFGLVGNALTLPLISIVVMPAAVIGVLALPFGLDRPVWEVMGVAVERVLQVSGWVADFDGSTLVVPAFGPGTLALFIAALTLATVLVSPLRWLAVVPGAAALALSGAPDRQDVFVDRTGAGAAVRGREGRLVVVGKPSSFVLEQWLKADGDGRAADDDSVRAGARCDRLGCTVETSDGRVVAFVLDRAAFPEDCSRAAIVVSRLYAPSTCGASVVVDCRFLDAHGATAIRLANGATAVTTARRPNEDAKPWLNRTIAPRSAAVTPPSQARPPPRRPATPDDDPGEIELDQ